MNEYTLIHKFFGDCPQVFETDAQLIDINGQTWGMTCDEFSLEEDRFCDKNPYILGCNVVAATLSDLYATGCEPRFYQQALILPQNKSERWISALVDGIKTTLNQANCVLIGGDMGQSRRFRYTGIALGVQRQKISRLFPNIRQKLYVTGKLGDMNEAVLKHRPTPLIELRPTPPQALACIDTSGGLMDALWLLHRLNPSFQINITHLPDTPIPYLIGGAGEYELLFTATEKPANAFELGEVVPQSGGLYINRKEITQAPPDARDYSFLRYLFEVMRYAHGLR